MVFLLVNIYYYLYERANKRRQHSVRVVRVQTLTCSYHDATMFSI